MRTDHAPRRDLTDPAKEILGRLCTPEFVAPPDWQTLIRSTTRKEIGDVGELYASWMLRSLNLDVRHLGGNNVGFDLEVVGRNGSPLREELRIEVKVDCARRCVRDTWGAWRWAEPARAFIFDYLVMINLNVGRRTHIIPRDAVVGRIFRHANRSAYSFRFGITDDSDRKEVGLLTGGRPFNGAWSLVRDHASQSM